MRWRVWYAKQLCFRYYERYEIGSYYHKVFSFVACHDVVNPASAIDRAEVEQSEVELRLDAASRALQ